MRMEEGEGMKGQRDKGKRGAKSTKTRIDV